MEHANHLAENRAATPDFVSIRWRPWPCASCGGSATALDFLVRCLGTNPEVPKVGRNEEIDWLKKWEAQRLLDWVGRCKHTDWLSMELPWVAGGSEHLVLYDEKTTEVVKITLPGTYGDYYFILTAQGMVPIDVRIWGIPIGPRNARRSRRRGVVLPRAILRQCGQPRGRLYPRNAPRRAPRCPHRRGCKQLKPEDLGIDPASVNDRLIHLGHKRLVPKEALAPFALIESRAHAAIEAASFPFLGGIARFVPNTRLEVAT